MGLGPSKRTTPKPKTTTKTTKITTATSPKTSSTPTSPKTTTLETSISSTSTTTTLAQTSSTTTPPTTTAVISTLPKATTTATSPTSIPSSTQTTQIPQSSTTSPTFIPMNETSVEPTAEPTIASTESGTQSSIFTFGTTTTTSNESGNIDIPWYAVVVPVLVLLVGFVTFVVVRNRRKLRQLQQSVNRWSQTVGTKRAFSHKYNRPINVANFEAESVGLVNDHFKLHAEYEKLDSISPKLPQTLDALAADNSYKNRFTDILPFDENRVRLNQKVSTPVPSTSQALPDLIPTSDYINASLLEGFHNRYEYIAAMGPIGEDEIKQNTSRRRKIATVQDFLEMIMQQDVQVIIMMTMPLEEHNLQKKVKCAQYWPNDVDETVDFGNHSVTLITEEYLSDDYDVRLLRITKGPHKHLARHFLYKDMKDYGVTHEDKMLEFVRSVRKFVENDSPLKPLLVHCSAGVGRSGTFIAIDQLLQQLDQNTKVLDVFKTVYNLRKQRVRMVQNQDQYRLIYQSVSLAVHRKLNLDPTTIATENEYENDNGSEPVYENVVKRQSVAPEQERIRQLNREVSATNIPVVRLSQLSTQMNGNGQIQSVNGDRVPVKIEPEPKREPLVASNVEF